MDRIWCLCLSLSAACYASAQDEPAEIVLATRKEVNILDSYISYLDTGDVGEGDNTVVFVHGIPTAAYLWRNVIPHVSPIARCLAPDLIGFGHSGKLANVSDYSVAEEYRYFSAWMDEMDLPDKLTLVVHDWGSGIGLRWANEHRDRVQAIAFMEAMISFYETWDDMPEQDRTMTQAIRSDAGEELILKQNMFVEQFLPMNIERTLSSEEMAEYRRPFPEEESLNVLLAMARSIPVGSDGPKDVVDFVTAYRTWMSSTDDLPKLYFEVPQGPLTAVTKPVVVDWPNLKTVVVEAKHFLQEDAPDEIGEAIAEFLTDRVYASSGTVVQLSLIVFVIPIVMHLI